MDDLTLFILLIILVSIGVAIFISDNRTNKAIKAAKENIQQKQPQPTANYKITGVSLVKKRKGTATGVVGVVLTIALWLWYLVTCEITVLQAQMINFFTLTAIAALVSFFGLCFGDSSSMLLAGVALVGAFLLDYGAVLGLIPAILLMVSSAQMKNGISLKVDKQKIEKTTQTDSEAA